KLCQEIENLIDAFIAYLNYVII
ncbi:MAG: hypothetical protein HeimC2_45750, partial [Candidatus Heimdallarchaeota archaeon LC_2]